MSEFIFKFKKCTLNELYSEVAKHLQVELEGILIAKSLPHKFEWIKFSTMGEVEITVKK